MQLSNILSLLIAVSFCGALSSGALAGERVYKWVDENGVVHFGQQPPSTTNAEELKVQQGYSRPAEKAPDETSPEQNAAAEDTLTCKRARDNLAALSAEGEVKRRDDYGEVHVLTEEEKATEKARAQAAIDRACKPAAPAETVTEPATASEPAAPAAESAP